MKVTIWDLEYYYAKNRRNCKNLTAMKLSSWHKQQGDQVLFVTSPFDIDRYYDICYIIKEEFKTPAVPARFLLDQKVRWLGASFVGKHNWTPPKGFAGCRPDYLLYPELDTKEERAEYVTLFNYYGEFLPHLQNWTNSFKNKLTIIQDKYMWKASKNNLMTALKLLQDSKNVVFFEPISIQKLISDKDIKKEFFKLKLVPSRAFPVKWTVVGLNEINEALAFLKEFKAHYKNMGCGQLTLDWHDAENDHWKSKEKAQKNFADVRQMILMAKIEQVPIKIMMPPNRFDTPYFFLFEELANWSNTAFKDSWLEYISKKYLKVIGEDAVMAWNNPARWPETFRSLLIQTWYDSEFLRRQWGEKMLSELNIPWVLWKEQFKYGI